MGFDNLFHYANLTLEVFLVNLLLSGDNAVVIALACRSLPPALTRRAMLIGIDAAIALRVLLTVFASFLLSIPLLKLLGGVALTAIAVKLTVAEQGETRYDERPPKDASGLWSAVGTIIAADLVMSVDNVVALAAVAHGSIFILTMGLLMSVPLLMFGSVFVAVLLRRYPLLKRGGGAMLGWLAGDIAISDPMVSDWVNQQSPALTIVVPFLVAVFVLIESRIMEDAQAAAYALRPRLRPTPTPAVITPPPAVITPPPAIIEKAPAPISAAENMSMPRQPEPVRAQPTEDAATSPVQAPRRKRIKPVAWIAAVISVALLYMLFKLLSLDFSTTAPALHWTPPTGRQ
ncbi:MAG TPA: TerC family protein [Steroidobacteraceae bacterium]|nr:TerC family protein [Steroidobacteraceae bacterium]